MPKTIYLSPDEASAIKLGYGYDEVNRENLECPFKINDLVIIPDDKSSFEFKYSYFRSEIDNSKIFNFDLSAAYENFIFKAKISTSLAKESRSYSDKLNILYTYNKIFEGDRIDPSKKDLDPDAIALLKDKTEFVNAYSDNYVSAKKRGAAIIIKIAMTKISSEETQKIGASLSADASFSFGSGELSTNIRKLIDDKIKNNEIEISASVFGATQASENAILELLKFDTNDSCQTVTEKIIKASKEITFQNSKYIGITLNPLREFGLKNGQKYLIDDSLKENKISQMVEFCNQNISSLIFLNGLENLMRIPKYNKYLTPDVKARIKPEISKQEEYSKNLLKQYKNCRENNWNCDIVKVDKLTLSDDDNTNKINICMINNSVTEQEIGKRIIKIKHPEIPIYQTYIELGTQGYISKLDYSEFTLDDIVFNDNYVYHVCINYISQNLHKFSKGVSSGIVNLIIEDIFKTPYPFKLCKYHMSIGPKKLDNFLGLIIILIN